MQTVKSLSPIILFVYNRPSHTRRTLEALEQNILADQSELYIFSDGPKADQNIDQVHAVRTLIREPWKFKHIHIIERPHNKGLANNVIDGVSHVVKNHGKVIVLEDDVLFSPYTLQYFNEALHLYESNEKVMHIGGFMYELDRSKLSETFFTRYVASQAWATWQRAWQYFEPDIEQIVQQFDQKKVEAFTFGNTMNFWRQIQQQRHGKVDSWAVRWYASVFLKGGLALEPSQSLIENIGHDGSGVHSAISTMFETSVKTAPVTYFPQDVEEDLNGYKALGKYFKHRKGSLWERAKRYVANKLLKH